MSEIGRMLVFVGLALVALGAALWLAGRVPFLGRLPGDIRIERDGFVFYFPLATCVLLSIVLTIALNLFLRR